ncbi:potassium-transporting ATPase subunit KdpC [Legionella cardiaca]|uniref:Potassium-transporting ATPase KdpC subunit n=1 Tax=Legionella cardiaca TaxID=1071983 RepID=A0ABY8AYM6_9GAMM|nr:potassium-transporting ATPase subunit KdpC [Legionella cardiaca]WED44571.1 potassium-transporting ATPase subunit KdpC [Legionella cardiaca]
MLKDLKTAFVLLILITVITGLIYPLAVTAFAQLFFPWKANGSLMKQDEKVIGSLLIGQSFDAPQYFWGRPSATSPFPYNSASSSGSNMGPSNPAFLATVKERIAHLKEYDSLKERLIPVDLVTASGSGLDPEISPLAAFYQVPRIAKARNIPEKDIEIIINRLIKNRTFFVLGEPRINVLELNMALDLARSAHDHSAAS